MYNNPGKAKTIYEIPEMVGCAYPESVTPAIIQSGFRIMGIHPFNENVFTDDEFLPPEISNRVQEQPSEMEINDDEQPGTSGVPTSTSEHIRPFKKAPQGCVISTERLEAQEYLQTHQKKKKDDLQNVPNDCHHRKLNRLVTMLDHLYILMTT